MYPVQILLPFRDATFSQASGDGNTLFNSQGSPQTLLESGQDPALASPSASQGEVKEPPMKDTCGQNSVGSLTSATLQLCLESRLRQRLDVNGSLEYDLTWKHWDMLSGPPICALRASARHTSARGSTGELSGWGTPSTRDFKDSGGAFEQNPDIVPEGGRLPRQVMRILSGWPTTRATDMKGHRREELAYRKATGKTQGMDIPTISGLIIPSPTFPTEKKGVLNPEHSRWLMGFPIEWSNCVDMVMPSSRK